MYLLGFGMTSKNFSLVVGVRTTFGRVVFCLSRKWTFRPLAVRVYHVPLNA